MRSLLSTFVLLSLDALTSAVPTSPILRKPIKRNNNSTTAVQWVPSSYAALGDSYASGFGAGAFLNSSSDGLDNVCGRSNGSYPFQMVVSSDAPFNPTEPLWRDFYACSGAKLEDMDGQIQRLGNKTVDVVSLQIGGNNFHFSDIVKACIYNLDPFKTEEVAQKECSTVLDQAQSLLNDTSYWDAYRGNVSRIYSEVLSNKGLLVVLGYAHFFPPNATAGDVCDNFPTKWSILKSHLPLRAANRLRMNDLVTRVNLQIQLAIHRLQFPVVGSIENSVPNIAFMPIDGLFSGHRFCESINAADPMNATDLNIWFNELNTPLLTNDVAWDGPYGQAKGSPGADIHIGALDIDILPSAYQEIHTMHPKAEAHAEITRALIQQIRLMLGDENADGPLLDAPDERQEYAQALQPLSSVTPPSSPTYAQLQPSSSYAQLQPTFGYAPPQSSSSYAQLQPSSTYALLQPSSTYGPPQSSSTYAQPWSAYAQPVSTYAPPPSSNGQPVSTYEQPSSTNGQPKPLSTYAQPWSTYGQPVPTYEQPSSTYEQPQSLSTNAQPWSAYGQPVSTYAPPPSSNGQPVSTYEQPSSTYEQPQPLSTYAQPWSTYGQPVSTYTQPPSSYVAAPMAPSPAYATLPSNGSLSSPMESEVKDALALQTIPFPSASAPATATYNEGIGMIADEEAEMPAYAVGTDNVLTVLSTTTVVETTLALTTVTPTTSGVTPSMPAFAAATADVNADMDMEVDDPSVDDWSSTPTNATFYAPKNLTDPMATSESPSQSYTVEREDASTEAMTLPSTPPANSSLFASNLTITNSNAQVLDDSDDLADLEEDSSVNRSAEDDSEALDPTPTPSTNSTLSASNLTLATNAQRLSDSDGLAGLDDDDSLVDADADEDAAVNPTLAPSTNSTLPASNLTFTTSQTQTVDESGGLADLDDDPSVDTNVADDTEAVNPTTVTPSQNSSLSASNSTLVTSNTQRLSDTDGLADLDEDPSMGTGIEDDEAANPTLTPLTNVTQSATNLTFTNSKAQMLNASGGPADVVDDSSLNAGEEGDNTHVFDLTFPPTTPNSTLNSSTTETMIPAENSLPLDEDQSMDTDIGGDDDKAVNPISSPWTNSSLSTSNATLTTASTQNLNEMESPVGSDESMDTGDDGDEDLDALDLITDPGEADNTNSTKAEPAQPSSPATAGSPTPSSTTTILSTQLVEASPSPIPSSTTTVLSTQIVSASPVSATAATALGAADENLGLAFGATTSVASAPVTNTVTSANVMPTLP